MSRSGTDVSVDRSGFHPGKTSFRLGDIRVEVDLRGRGGAILVLEADLQELANDGP